MTPYYSEDVIFAKVDLEQRTDEFGISTLLYMQTSFRTDWIFFRKTVSIHDENKFGAKKISRKRVIG